MIVCLRWLCHHMMSVSNTSRESWILFLVIILCSLMMYSNNRIHCDPKGRIRLFAFYTASLSPLCKRMWKYGSFKMLVRYILSSLCLRLGQFSQLPFMQYMGLCVFSLLIFLLTNVRICVPYLTIIKSKVWPICLCFEKMVYALSFYILILMVF